MSAPRIEPPAWLGVVGGGQLGQMFALAAQAAGYRVAVYSNADHSPAAQVADRVTVGAYDDAAAVAEFAKGVEALSFEFENISAPAAYAAEKETIVRPQARILEAVQQRYREKELLRSHGFPTAPYRYVKTREDVERAVEELGEGAVFKTAASGYDGHGQVRLVGPESLRASGGAAGERTGRGGRMDHVPLRALGDRGAQSSRRDGDLWADAKRSRRPHPRRQRDPGRAG